jgi:hypothetical protein
MLRTSEMAVNGALILVNSFTFVLSLWLLTLGPHRYRSRESVLEMPRPDGQDDWRLQLWAEDRSRLADDEDDLFTDSEVIRGWEPGPEDKAADVAMKLFRNTGENNQDGIYR